MIGLTNDQLDNFLSKLMPQKVHCLKCDCVYPEHHSHSITECPYCGNPDMEQTVYLQKED